MAIGLVKVLVAAASLSLLACGGDGTSGDDDSTAPDAGVIGQPDGGGVVLPGACGLSAPVGAYRGLGALEIRNDRSFQRDGEIAFSAVPLGIAENVMAVDGLVVVDAQSVRVPAQFNVLSRWGGTLDDDSRPIRWLQVSVPASVSAEATLSYALRNYQVAVSTTDECAVVVAQQETTLTIDTGVLRATLSPSSPSLFSILEVASSDDRWRTVYDGSAPAGPRLVLADGTVLDDAGAHVRVHAFEVVERGPVKAVVQARGYFTHPSHPEVHASCGSDGASYDRFAYTMVASFFRGSGDIHLEYHLRNECGDGVSGPWTDQAITINQASWEFPLVGLDDARILAAGSGEVQKSEAGSLERVSVEQRRGGDASTWEGRIGRVRIGDELREVGETVDSPLLALDDGELIASLQLAWMRYREPQALVAQSGALSLQVVSEPIILGEAKAIWNHALLSFAPSPKTAAELSLLRQESIAKLERGLLVRRPLAQFNASRIYPSLGQTSGSQLERDYAELLDRIHDDTVNSQWARSKTYGAQLWPDVQYDSWAMDNDTPFESDGAMNYWNPMGTELYEFFRTGDPKWVWDFSLPQAYLQSFTAYYNIGEQPHGTRNGFAVSSGGSGEGQWHRSAQGSDDYAYNQGIDEAYLVRPTPTLRDRFRQAGTRVAAQYSVPRSEQDRRDIWTQAVEIKRGPMQLFDMLANCAELVPGAAGAACHQRLQEIMAELAEENLRAGALCQADLPDGASCATPQTFMINSMLIHSLVRYLYNYGDPTGFMRPGLSAFVRTFYDQAMAKREDGSIDPDGCWWAGMICQLRSDGTGTTTCEANRDSDGLTCIYEHNRGQTLAMLLIGHELDPSIDTCGAAKAVLDQPGALAVISGLADSNGGPGWYKPTAQAMQAIVFAVGGYDTCE